jgi:hypothetical protein
MDKLTKIIQSAVPEIMELKLGCHIAHGVYLGICLAHCDKRYIYSQDFNMRQPNKVCIDNVEILGRPITLEDVMMAIPDNRLLKGEKQKGIIVLTTGNGSMLRGVWKLNTPLHEQSQEVIDFLLDLLDKE